MSEMPFGANIFRVKRLKDNISIIKSNPGFGLSNRGEFRTVKANIESNI